MHRKVLLALLGIGLLATLAGIAGLAVFTDQENVDGNTFSTSEVDLGVAPTTALVSFSDMVPGDSVTDDIVVSNDGGAQFRYAISSAATNADTLGLKDLLTLTIKTIDVTTPLSPCDDFDGTQLYTGDLDGATGLLVGDPAQGDDSGDRVLDTGTSETLCFSVDLDISATAPESATTTATFTFDAEQTANNP